MIITGLVKRGNARPDTMTIFEISVATTIAGYVLDVNMAIVTQAPCITKHVACTCYQEGRQEQKSRNF